MSAERGPPVLSVAVEPGGRHSEIEHAVGAMAWECDASSLRVTYVSSAVGRVFGYAAADWLQPNFLAGVVHPDDQGPAVRVIAAARRAETGFEQEARMRAA